tara:strand:+ start:258 stop:716 length:459 start_codon:yes stop_codon:yes gene_type:complete
MSDNNSTLNLPKTQSNSSEMMNLPKTQSLSSERKDFSNENSNDENGVSLYIPFVFTYVTRQMIIQKMEESYGTVHRVDMKFATNSKGQRHKKVYVHFKKNSWYKTEEAQKILKTLQNGEPVQLTWVDNWFWKIFVSKSKRVENKFNESFNNE